jgi:hypothetical protein
MDLIAFETLDITHQEEIESEHGITDGFIVDLVCDDSTAGRLGISRGDVIVSYNGLRDFTLHTFEEYLLNLGWGFLESTDPSWTINLEVYFIVFLVLRILKLTTENIIYIFFL